MEVSVKLYKMVLWRRHQVNIDGPKRVLAHGHKIETFWKNRNRYSKHNEPLQVLTSHGSYLRTQIKEKFERNMNWLRNTRIERSKVRRLVETAERRTREMAHRSQDLQNKWLNPVTLSCCLLTLLGVPKHSQASTLQVFLVGWHDSIVSVFKQMWTSDVESAERKFLLSENPPREIWKKKLTSTCEDPDRIPLIQVYDKKSAILPRSLVLSVAALAVLTANRWDLVILAWDCGCCAPRPAHSSWFHSRRDCNGEVEADNSLHGGTYTGSIVDLAIYTRTKIHRRDSLNKEIENNQSTIIQLSW